MWSAHNVPHCGTYRARRSCVYHLKHIAGKSSNFPTCSEWAYGPVPPAPAYRMAVRPYIEFAEGKHIDKNSLQEQKSIFLLSQSGRMARRRCRLGVQKGACGTPAAMPPVEDSRKGGKGGNGLLFPVGCGIIKGQAALPLGASESSVSERKRRCGRQSCKK